MREAVVSIPGYGGITLRGAVSIPDENTRRTAVIITHPYGPLGGDLNNNVVTAMAERMQSLGYLTVRYNSRGIGGSTGRVSWRGNVEVEDIKCVCTYVLGLRETQERERVDRQETSSDEQAEEDRKEKDGKPLVDSIILIGYSYGSAIASAAADSVPQIIGYAAISFPFSVLWAITAFNSTSLLSLAKTKKPKFFIIGDRDNFTSLSAFRQSLSSFPEPKSVALIEGADHFWFGAEEVVCGRVAEWCLHFKEDQHF